MEACIDKGDDNVFSMPHKPNESSENNSRTVGLCVNDGEDLEELARACEIEELTAILSALALGMKSSCAFYERYRTHKVPSFLIIELIMNYRGKRLRKGKRVTTKIASRSQSGLKYRLPRKDDGEQRGQRWTGSERKKKKETKT